MKKITTWSAAIAALGSVALFSACGGSISEAEVRNQVEAANYCKTAAECVVAPAGCPFNYELVNVKEQEKVAALYERCFAGANTSCTALTIRGSEPPFLRTKQMRRRP